MSDYYALTVVLEKDINSEEAQKMIEAIKLIKGVLEVTPHVADFALYSAESRARFELGQKLIGIVYPDLIKSR